ncbi:MAG: porin family protein [Bacteroidota bacterium]
MKNNLLLVLAILCTTVMLQAQSKVTINPKVGVNVSGLEKDLIDYKTNARVGYNVGLDLRIGEGAFKFFPGAHYYNFTADLISEATIDNMPAFEDETTIQQLKVPLNVGLYLTEEGGILNLYAKGGVTPSFLLGVNEKDNFSLTSDDIRNIVLGANVGVGIDLINFLNIELNYEIGLNDFFVDQGGRNNVITLSAGLAF